MCVFSRLTVGSTMITLMTHAFSEWMYMLEHNQHVAPPQSFTIEPHCTFPLSCTSEKTISDSPSAY